MALFQEEGQREGKNDLKMLNATQIFKRAYHVLLTKYLLRTLLFNFHNIILDSL